MDRREDLIGLLAESLGRIRETGDPTQAMAPGVAAVAADLARGLDRGDPRDVEVRYLLGWLRWYQAATLAGDEQRVAIGAALDLLTPAATMIGKVDFPAPLLPALADRLVATTPEGHPELAYRLSALGAALLTRFRQTGDRRDVDDAVAAVRRAVLLGAGDSGLDIYLLNLCAVLKTRHEHTRDAADLDEAVDAGRRAVAAATDQDRLASALANLSGALLTRFTRAGRPDDLAGGTAAARRAVATARPTDPHRPAMLNNLASALHNSFTHGGPAADLDDAVHAGRLAAREGVGHPDEGMFLSNLVDSLRSRFDRGGATADLDEAVAAGRRLVSITGADGAVRANRLMGLASSLSVRYDRVGDPADLNELISVGRAAVDAAPGSSALLAGLGSGLLTRYAAARAATDLAEAAAVARHAVALAGPAEPGSRVFALLLLDRVLSADPDGSVGGPDEVVATRRAIVEATPADDDNRCERLSGLAFALLDRFGHASASRDLDEAVETARAARTAAATDVDRLYCLSDLCGTLFARFTHHGTRGDLDEAASLARGVVAPPDSPPGVLLNLAHVLDQHARVAAELADLDAAIGLVRHVAAAMAAGPPPAGRERPYIQLRATDIWHERPSRHQPAHAEALRLLGAYLLRRFEWTTVRADADDAVEVRRQVVAMTGGDDPEHARSLASLSYALKVRFLSGGRPEDLDEAVETGRRAAALDADDTTYLVSLSDTSKLRFEQGGVESDLDDAIDMGRRAIRLLHDDSVRPANAWANLSSLLRTRFDLHLDPADLDEAVDAARRAVAAGREHDFDRPKWLYSHAEALRMRIRHAGRGLDPHDRADPETDRAEALRVITELVGHATAAPGLRIRGAAIGAWLAVEERAPGTEDLTLAADLLETAVHLMPEVAPRRMRRHEQQDAVQSATGIADSAAVVALLAPDRPPKARAQRALSLLEAGRAVLLSQLLDTRGDLTDLRGAHPELAARFTALRDVLDTATDDTAADRIGAAGELSATLREIRRLDGFATFALPPTAAELHAAAGAGPVVTFTVAQRGAALLLTEDGVTALPLPGLTAPAVVDQVNAFHVALREAYDPSADRAAAQTVLAEVLKWLWDNVTGPVLDALGYTGPPAAAHWPRVWWVPGGYLSLLPLHAAGHHDDPASARTVLDRVVSSYTPTIRTLRHARRRQAAAAGGQDRSLIVAMPVTPGLPELRNVRTETDMLTRVLPEPLALTEPVRDRVLAELPRHRIAHFACHGTYDAGNPANSGLLLHDHESSPLTVGDLNAVNLDSARFAYLSACHTAVNPSDRLLDEVMHLAGALQAAGYPQVVGTLWELDDEVAVEITEDFYRGLAGTGALDLGGAAYSLHRAVRTQRDAYPGTPSLWAAHLHFGA